MRVLASRSPTTTEGLAPGPLRGLYRLARRLAPRVPFTPPRQILRALDGDAGSILDVGCGRGDRMEYLNPEGRRLSVGLDIFPPYLDACRRRRTHAHLVLADARRLPFADDSFDIVLALEVIEHLEKGEGYRLLEDLERVARRRVVVSTPAGAYHQHGLDGNPHQEHVSRWTAAELRALGYRVAFNGLRGVCGEGSLEQRLPPSLRPLWYIVTLLPGPLVQLTPALAGNIIADKRVG